MTAPALPPPEMTRESVAPLLLRRFRLIMPIVLGTTGVFAVVHVWLEEPNLGLLMALEALQLTIAILAYAVACRNPRRIVIVTSLVVLAASVNLITAATGFIIGNINTLLYVVVSLASSSFLPWGVRAQAASAASAALAVVAPSLLGVPLDPDIWYDIAALGAVFAVSCYIAGEVESDTLAEHRAQTATQALADSRATFEGVFQSSVVGLGLIELKEDDLVCTLANERLATMFNVGAGDLVGRSVSVLGYDGEETEFWKSTYRRAAVEGLVRIPEYRLDIVQPVRWYEVSISAIHDPSGRVNLFSLATVDITERKRAADDVDRLNRELEAKVEERTSLLAAANRDLQSFAYSVSHDLRTPLRSIEGFATLLADDHAGELSVNATSQLGRIRAASRHMAQLIDDMLTLSRVVRGEVSREKVDLSAIAREISAELTARAPERDVRVSIEHEIVATGDARLLRIVVSNLLTNAWKYTGRRPTAHVEVGGAAEGNEVVFFVRDDGCGFDKRFAHKLFRPFQRLHSPEEYEGTGIGLATVARIVQRHRGRVWAEGTVDRGATFSFALPLHATADQADTDDGPPESPS